jgi:predicted ATPase
MDTENYRLSQSTALVRIPRLCVLVGAYGSGKSTLFDVFSFLKDALAINVSKAVAKRGEYKELVSRGHVGEPIELPLQNRPEITGHDAWSPICSRSSRTTLLAK